MEVLLDVALVIVGFGLVGWVVLTAIKTFVVPRAQRVWLARAVFVIIRLPLDAWVRRHPEHTDRVFALYAPVALLALPVVWSYVIAIGFALVFYGLDVRPWSEALITSGSSLLTLGFERPESGLAVAVTFLEALIGLGVVALVIGYLPTIYGAFARREALVGSLETSAGVPPSAVEMLVRYERIGLTHRYEETWRDWTRWFADIEESHSSQASLPFFRSPQPQMSWLTAAGCVLDTAAFIDAVIDRPTTPEARLLIRQGYVTLRRIANNYGIDYPADPQQGDPISVSRTEWDAAVAQLEAAGIPLKTDREQAWRDWAGWRVNYDEPLIMLCAWMWAPPAPWSSDRRVELPRVRLFT